MSWNGLERNKLDFILTDLLPVELSELFSYTQFYNYLMKKNQSISLNSCLNKIKNNKARGLAIMEDGWSTKPLKYNIMKGTNTTREMSILQPLSVINAYLFMECYQKEILDYLSRTPSFSLRYHKKKTDLYYKTRSKKIIEYFQKQSDSSERNAIQQTGAYFNIYPFESINAFTSSRKWREANFCYDYYAKIDYKSCFDSIYTHSFSWIIERNTVDAKKAKNPQLFVSIDRVLENINGRYSNGIVVGPEFSRMMAEILLQYIDYSVRILLEKAGIEYKRDYVVYRYVDDIFIFTKEQRLINEIIDGYTSIGKKFRLQLNELKLSKGDTPCLPKEWLERTRTLSDVISNLFFKGKKADYEKMPEEQRHIVITDNFPVDRVKDEIAVLIKTYSEDKRTIVSFLLSIFVNQIGKIKKGYKLFGKNCIGQAMLIIDLVLYIYSFFPSFDQSRKVISIISYINKEINFKNNELAKIKLQNAVRRYYFVFQKGNLFDICDWFPFFSEYGISLDVLSESRIVQKAEVACDPIIWGNILLYSRYNCDFYTSILQKVEQTVNKELNRLILIEPMMQKEFWYIIIFHNCPYLSPQTIDRMNSIIDEIKTAANHNLPSQEMELLVCGFMQQKSQVGRKPEDSFFNWKGKKNFSDQIAYRTYQRTMFKKYKTNKFWLSTSIE